LTPYQEFRNAQKATSDDEERINAPEGREQHQVCGQRCSALEKMMISPLVAKVNPPPNLLILLTFARRQFKNYRRMVHVKAA
jgi:hypothetical protein